MCVGVGERRLTLPWRRAPFGSLLNTPTRRERERRDPALNGGAGGYARASGLHYNRFRYYDPGVGRYVSADPIGQRGGINLYTYAANNPTNLTDPYGLLTAIIVGGPTSSNPFGHTAIATTSGGVTSFGTENLESRSLISYLESQSEYRDSTVYILPTTPEQEAAIDDYLAQFAGEPLPPVPSADSDDTCASRTHGALAAAGIYDPSNPWSVVGSMLGVHSPLPEAGHAIGTVHSGGLSVSVPRGTTQFPAIFRAFGQ